MRIYRNLIKICDKLIIDNPFDKNNATLSKLTQDFSLIVNVTKVKDVKISDKIDKTLCSTVCDFIKIKLKSLI